MKLTGRNTLQFVCVITACGTLPKSFKKCRNEIRVLRQPGGGSVTAEINNTGKNKLYIKTSAWRSLDTSVAHKEGVTGLKKHTQKRREWGLLNK